MLPRQAADVGEVAGGGRQVGCLEVLFLRLPGVGWADGVETNADAVKGVEEEGEEGFCCLLL